MKISSIGPMRGTLAHHDALVAADREEWTRRIAFAAVLLFVAPAALRAQTPYLVKDLNMNAATSARSSRPEHFFRYGSRVVFKSSTEDGYAIWITDGTEAGTVRLLDGPRGDSWIPRFAMLNDKLLFNAYERDHGEELWISDGTSAGTRLLADIGRYTSQPGDRIVYRSSMIFSADDRVNGRELWITDGTAAGTRLFADLVAGPEGSEPRAFVLFDDLIYFVAAGGLWKSDGTVAGTTPVVASLEARDLTVAGSRMYFAAPVSDRTVRLWVSDGTSAGTNAVEASPALWPFALDLTAFGDRVLFRGRGEGERSLLWISDGTSTGTRTLAELSRAPQSIALAGDSAYFAGWTPATGYELWKTDGTESGTTLVRDIHPGTGSGLGGLTMTTSGGKVYLVGGYRLWTTDGTADGTFPVKTAEPIPRVGDELIAAADGTIYFAAGYPETGSEPWRSDGTDAGTVMIANLLSDPAPSSKPNRLTSAGSLLFFSADDDLGSRELWRTDGTPEGTLKLTRDRSSDWASHLMAAGTSLFFRRGAALWMTDGTPESTMPATEFVSRFPQDPWPLHVMSGGTLLVYTDKRLWATTLATGAPAVEIASTPYAPHGFVNVVGRTLFGPPLWSTDGTRPGTHVVARTIGGYGSAGRAVMGGHLYFVGGRGDELWKSDGTNEGSVAIFASSVRGFEPGDFVATHTTVFFLSKGDLWVTDGTDAGTRALPARPLETPVATGDRVVFNALDPEKGHELWVSDGTAEGTHLLRDIYPGAEGSSPSRLASAGGRVYFTATDDLHGSEAWVTDGTVEGTKLVGDIEPGPGGSSPGNYVQAGEHLFFVATTSATGDELWACSLSPIPRLAVSDLRLREGNSATTSARFVVALSSPAARTVTVDYLTGNGAAVAGSDYDATSGTLVFEAGQTTTTIDVPVRGDTVIEGNESFFLTLRNADGAMVEKSSAFALVDDDDRNADLALTLDFSFIDYRGATWIHASNAGPSMATNVAMVTTATPYDAGTSACPPCPRMPPELAAGTSLYAYEHQWRGFQQYLTATVDAWEADLQTSNNSVGWTSNGAIAMDALFLTPGSQANVWFYAFRDVPGVSIESSDPSVVSVPAGMTLPNERKPLSFVARGVGVGKATIRVFTPTHTFGTLTIDVIEPGTKLRWPGGASIVPLESAVQFDEETRARISNQATAPFTGERATGDVIIKANGRETGRITLTAEPRVWEVPYRAVDGGTNTIEAVYTGDANFLPMTKTWNLTVTRGFAGLTGVAYRDAGTLTIEVRGTGSPMAAPSGIVSVEEPGAIPAASVPLTETAPGVAQASITLNDVASGPHRLVIHYSGDTRYEPRTQILTVSGPPGGATY